jgi:hypothetical protein
VTWHPPSAVARKDQPAPLRAAPPRPLGLDVSRTRERMRVRLRPGDDDAAAAANQLTLPGHATVGIRPGESLEIPLTDGRAG